MKELAEIGSVIGSGVIPELTTTTINTGSKFINYILIGVLVLSIILILTNENRINKNSKQGIN